MRVWRGWRDADGAIHLARHRPASLCQIPHPREAKCNPRAIRTRFIRGMIGCYPLLCDQLGIANRPLGSIHPRTGRQQSFGGTRSAGGRTQSARASVSASKLDTSSRPSTPFVRDRAGARRRARPRALEGSAG